MPAVFARRQCSGAHLHALEGYQARSIRYLARGHAFAYNALKGDFAEKDTQRACRACSRRSQGTREAYPTKGGRRHELRIYNREGRFR